MEFKKQIHTTCLNFLNEKIQSLHAMLADLKDGITNDSKSSAGDKHETSRAMAQLEIEKISKQLYEFNIQKEALQKIDSDLKTNVVVKGSVVETDRGLFYLSVALGKIMIDHREMMVLSTQSPLGQKLLGLKVNDTVQINTAFYLIKNIL